MSPSLEKGDFFTPRISTWLDNRPHIRLVLLSKPLRSPLRKPQLPYSHHTLAPQGEHVAITHTTLVHKWSGCWLRKNHWYYPYYFGAGIEAPVLELILPILLWCRNRSTHTWADITCTTLVHEWSGCWLRKNCWWIGTWTSKVMLNMKQRQE